MTLKRVLPALGLLGALASSASAQSPTGLGFSWILRGVEFSACVDFLMDPVLASKQLAQGYRVVAAGSFDALAPVLRQEVTRDSVLLGWVPAQICFIESPTITAGDAVLSPDKKMGTREVVGYWAIAATRLGATAGLDQWYAATLWTNDWHVKKRTEAVFIPVSVIKHSLTPVPESTHHRFSVKVGKTVLSWDGELVGRDSTESTESRQANLALVGQRDIHWAATVSSRPEWTRNVPGVFRVEGKDDLAKALKASPIRMFGPMFWGGDARVEFSR